MRTPAERLRQYLMQSLAAYEAGGQRVASTFEEACAALASNDYSYGPDWFRVLALIRFLDVPEIRGLLERELQGERIDRRFYAALLLALLGSNDGLRLLEESPTLSASGIEAGLALLARAVLGKLEARELETKLAQVPNARAFGLCDSA